LKDNSDNSAIKLIDFGAAAEIGPFSELAGIIGTTFYMAPEILMKRPYGKLNMLLFHVLWLVFA
jgi:serine/threonine protein kinase